MSMILSCGRVGLFPRKRFSLQQGAEYLAELIWQSCMKLKLHPRPVPCANYKSCEHDTPAEQFTICWSEINLELFA